MTFLEVFQKQFSDISTFNALHAQLASQLGPQESHSIVSHCLAVQALEKNFQQGPAQQLEQQLEHMLFTKKLLLQSGFFILQGQCPVPSAVLALSQALLQQRLAGWPLAYLLGWCYFYDLPLGINSYCLIPRPDTEILVEAALTLIDTHDLQQVLDLGTGSGAVILALKHQRPYLKALATDICPHALQRAARNGALLGLAVSWVNASWCAGLAEQSFDLIVSNPPYIGQHEHACMNTETQHEPSTALFAADAGLQAFKDIIVTGRRCLKSGGFLVLEHGFKQAHQVQQLLVEHGFDQINTQLDLQQHPRVTFGRWC